ncbi:ionotropic receptor 75a-like [Maniola jurtina]|uniref:ionotropic receptor 75a-like n=1 Tax=Maniola jurtina TaxID=191418 RepID=UPI001E68E4ED|nr:ionotropic receptor 75a-like [Maniola jurtina]
MLFISHIITISYVTPLILGHWIEFSVDYFKGRRVTFVCLLTCGEETWFHHNFAKYASTQNIAVSSFDIDKKLQNNSEDLDLCLKQTATSTGVLINPKCPYYEEIMYRASENVLFDSKHKWLIKEERDIFKNDVPLVNGMGDFEGTLYNETHIVNENEMTSISVLSNLNLSIDADIILSAKIDDSSFKLYEVYNFGKARNGKFVIKSIGDWNVDKGLNIPKEFKYYRRWDFQEMSFKMAVVMTPIPSVFDPQMILSMTPDYRVSTVSHTSAIILHEIAGIHNFRYNYTIMDIWVGDYIKEHKAVTNALYFREQDITPILRLHPAQFDRYDVITPPVTFIESRFYYRIPAQGVGNFENQFLRPFSSATWWCVIGICVLCCIVLLLSAIAENQPINVYHYSILSVMALICQQFFEEFEDLRRTSAAKKMTILVTGISCILIYNYYTSSVVSWLLNGPPPSINSLWELLSSPLQPILEDTGYTYSWLQLPDYYFNNKKADSEDALKIKLKNMMKKGKTIVASMNEGIELVRKGGYAYHAETNAANDRISRTFDQQELCDLDSLHSIEKVLLYSSLQKNSPYREFFSWSLARLLERGIFHCTHERTWSHEVKCAGSSPRALALGGAAPAFIVLAAGFILGTFIMLIERFCWKHGSKNRKPVIKTEKMEEWPVNKI